MAINVDTVYQRVLAILNKEQRGFVTPQKFNLFATHVQLEKVEQYHYDLEYALQLPGNSTEYSDMVELLEKKISFFETETSTPTFNTQYFELPVDCFRLGSVRYGTIEVTQHTKKEYLYIANSEIAKPSDVRPIFIMDQNGIQVYGDALFTDSLPSSNPITMQYMRTPSDVVWGYTELFGEPSYNAGASTDFELDPSEETDVIIRILSLAGLEVKDLSVYEVGRNEDLQEQQLEKQ